MTEPARIVATPGTMNRPASHRRHADDSHAAYTMIGLGVFPAEEHFSAKQLATSAAVLLADANRSLRLGY